MPIIANFVMDGTWQQRKFSKMDHEFMTGGDYRSCVNCDLRQTRRNDVWPIPLPANCPFTSPRGQKIARGETPKRGGPLTDRERKMRLK